MQDPGCKIRGCTGNITYWIDEEQDLLGFRLVHHKSMWNWGQAIEGVYPARFTAAVLKPYLKFFRKFIVKQANVQTVFVNRNGQPFSKTGLSIYYSKT